ncbi:MAG TPA: hypothetical protein VMB50_07490 [Myxococcales bacterium]|nr:hypothetical protein [Myxococcales bacterium]
MRRTPLALLAAICACAGSSPPADAGAACHPACPGGLVCQGGSCVPETCGPSSSCPAGLQCIAGFCASLGCDPPCAPAQTCLTGLCIPKQPATCGPTAPCNAPESCIAGFCVDTTCAPPCSGDEVCLSDLCLPPGGDSSCPPPYAGCVSAGLAYCANLALDATNCGSCGHACPSGELCSSGSCAVSCLASEDACTVEGSTLCIDPTSDDLNCGSCGAACPAGQACSQGACGLSCGPGLTLCGASPGLYCTDLAADAFDCGSCGYGCGAGEACQGGRCAALAGTGTGGGTSGGGSSSGGTTGAAGCGSFALVQAIPGEVTNNEEQGPGESLSLVERAGDLLVAIAYGGQGGSTSPQSTSPNMTFHVFDDAGNTYYPGPFYENSTVHQSAIQIFYAPDVVGGVNRVNLTASSPEGLGLYTGLFVEEYAGASQTNVVDVSTGRMAPSASAVTSPGPLTTNLCDLVVGAFVDGHTGGTPLDAGPGFRMTSADYSCPAGAVDDAPGGAAPGSVADPEIILTGPFESDDGWVAAQMAFRAAGTSAPAQPAQIAFATAPQAGPAGTCSGEVLVQSQSAASQPVNTSTGIAVALGGSGLSYYVDPGCIYAVDGVTIGAGTSSVGFYFVGSDAGAATIDATAAGFAPISQGVTLH